MSIELLYEDSQPVPNKSIHEYVTDKEM